jgi:predicted DCC family thiol-disulfide oxidoreductase YuxK
MTAAVSSNSPDLEVFYDGGCPLCRREMAVLKTWDRRGRIAFTDIDAAGFDAQALGKSQQELMDRIHGRLPNGDWVTGVEVFRRLYSAAGFGPLVALTRLPVISWTLDWGYRIFARNRLRMTGRCTADRCGV